VGVLIDPPSWPAHGRRWSHLVSDASLAELHAFARRLAIPERGFEGDHYDIPEERYPAVVAAGAIPVSSRELLRRLQASGLRRSKRRGERVLDSRLDPGTGQRVDVLLSTMAPLGPVVGVHLVIWAEHAVVCLPDDEGLTLPGIQVRGGPRPRPTTAEPTWPAQPALAALLQGVVGPGAADGLVRIGYLRRLEPGGPAAGQAELVLGRRWSGTPLPPASWVRLGQALGLLPVLLTPLVRRTIAGPAGPAGFRPAGG